LDGGTIVDKTASVALALAPIGALWSALKECPTHWSFTVVPESGASYTRTVRDLLRDLRRESGDTLKGTIR
jgi:hypothetical protein